MAAARTARTTTSRATKTKLTKVEKKALEQTKNGSFKLIGEITGLGRDNAENGGVSEKSGREWRSLRFGVKTSKENTVYVEIMGSEKDEFTIRNAESGDQEKVPFDDRFEDLPEGWHMMGLRMALEEEEIEGKLNKDGTPKTKKVNVTMQELDAIEYILENLSDGESVYVSGQIENSVYVNDKDEEKLQKRYKVQFISKQSKDVDFEDEEFEETAKFEQQIVITGTTKDQTDKTKMYVHALTINYKGEAIPSEFAIIADGKTKKLAAKIASFKFGTLLTVSGDIVNAYIESEVEDDSDDWGDSSQGYKRTTAKQRISEMLILFADASSLQEKYYSEADFVNEAKETFGKKEEEPEDEWGSKDDGRPIDISDDDLPF